MWSESAIDPCHCNESSSQIAAPATGETKETVGSEKWATELSSIVERKRRKRRRKTRRIVNAVDLIVNPPMTTTTRDHSNASENDQAEGNTMKISIVTTMMILRHLQETIRDGGIVIIPVQLMTKGSVGSVRQGIGAVPEETAIHHPLGRRPRLHDTDGRRKRSRRLRIANNFFELSLTLIG